MTVSWPRRCRLGFVRRLAVGLLALSLACAWSACAPGSPPAPAPARCLVMAHLNDFHGHLQPFDPAQGFQTTSVGGLARIATLVKQQRAEASRGGCGFLLLSSGDTIQGTALSTLFQGEVEFRAMNHLGLDAMTVGNHEFDFGLDRLKQLEGMAHFKLISANVSNASGRLLFPPYASFVTDDGLRVGLVGLTTDQTPTTTHPRNVAGLRFDNPSQRLKALLPVLKESHDVVIVLSHLGGAADEELARSVAGIDGILGGHSHELILPHRVVGGVFLAQSYEYGRVLGLLRITVTGDRVAVNESRALPVTPGIEPDSAIAALVAGYTRKVECITGRPVGRLEEPLPFAKPGLRSQSTELGSVVAEVMRQAAGASVAVVNAGAIRLGLPQGELTYGHIISMLPFNNTIVRMTMPGHTLLRILSRSWRESELDTGNFGGFLQLAGITVTVQDQRLIRVEVNGQPLDLDRQYEVATTDFLADGGDGYFTLAGLPRLDLGITMQDAMIWTLKNKSTLPGRTDWRRWVVP